MRIVNFMAPQCGQSYFLYGDCIIFTVIMYCLVSANEHSWGHRQTSTVVVGQLALDNRKYHKENLLNSQSVPDVADQV
jgi:ABC-type glucose/galactose transport system permease subunit